MSYDIESVYRRALARRDVSENGCWIYTGKAQVTKGYKLIGAGVSGRNLYVHRLSYMVNHGEIPDGMVVMHSCDQPACFNPEHLRAGTVAQNNADMRNKGRAFVPAAKRGDEHWTRRDPIRAAASAAHARAGKENHA